MPPHSTGASDRILAADFFPRQEVPPGTRSAVRLSGQQLTVAQQPCDWAKHMLTRRPTAPTLVGSDLINHVDLDALAPHMPPIRHPVRSVFDYDSKIKAPMTRRFMSGAKGI